MPPERLEEIGFKIAAYPLTLLAASIRAMLDALEAIGRGAPPPQQLPFAELREIVGFDAYDADLARFRGCDGDEED